MAIQWIEPTLFTLELLEDELQASSCGICGWPVDKNGRQDDCNGALEQCDIDGCPHSTAPTTTSV